MNANLLFTGLIALGTIIAPVFSQNVTNIQQSGAMVRVSLGSNIVDITPISDGMASICFKTNGVVDTPSEIVNPSLPTNAAFTSIQLTSDPATCSGAGYTIKIYKTPLSIEFLDGSGTSLFKTAASGLTATNLSASVISGSYYGANNGSNSQLSFSGSWGIIAGQQGYAGSPFLWTPKGLGILADAENGQLALNGTAYTLSRQSSTNANNLFFLMAGTPRQIMRNFYVATGSFPMPPRWATGYMHSEWGINEDEFKTTVATYRSKNIPIDLYILDYDWFKEQSQIGAYCWDGTKFPSAASGNLKKWTDSAGIKMVGIRKPRLNGANLDFYNKTIQHDYWNNFVTGTCNPVDQGIAGYWNDEGDYGGNFNFLFMQKSQYVGQRSYNDQRVWSINRNYFCGAHRYAYGLWSGDILATAYPQQPSQMLHSVSLGAAWWGCDIGGFYDSGDQEVYYRWMQMGAFQPIYRVHGSLDAQRTPWHYGTQAEAIAKSFIQLRYRMLPYIYSAFSRLHTEGLPLVRPLVMDYPNDAAVAERMQEFMFGDAMLVSPVTQKSVTSQDVYLPAGTWYDFWTGESVTGGRTVTKAITPEIIPVYVKAGSIIPLGKMMNYTAELANDTIEVRVYKGNDAHFDLYEDDGLTYGYETGNSSSIPIDWSNASSTLNFAGRTGSFSGMLQQRVFNVVVVGSGHGIGGSVTQTPDSRINYPGTTEATAQPSPTTPVLAMNDGASVTITEHTLVIAPRDRNQMVQILKTNGMVVRKIIVPEGVIGRISLMGISSGAYLVSISDGTAAAHCQRIFNK